MNGKLYFKQDGKWNKLCDAEVADSDITPNDADSPKFLRNMGRDELYTCIGTILQTKRQSQQTHDFISTLPRPMGKRNDRIRKLFSKMIRKFKGRRDK